MNDLAITGLLIAALFSTLLDARLQSTAFRLNQSLQDSNTQLQKANAELQQRAFTDPLTNLPNRLLFEDRLAHALLRMGRSNHQKVRERAGVLFVDLRDHYGMTQVVVDPDSGSFKLAETLRAEWVIRVD